MREVQRVWREWEFLHHNLEIFKFMLAGSDKSIVTGSEDGVMQTVMYDVADAKLSTGTVIFRMGGSTYIAHNGIP